MNREAIDVPGPFGEDPFDELELAQAWVAGGELPAVAG
jgi:hypothetical protein